MKEKMIKAGTIRLSKNHWFGARLWAKIRGKELPYNGGFLYVISTPYVGEDGVYLEPSKAYSMVEKLKLIDYHSNTTTNCIGESDLAALINYIRPNTVAEKGFKFEDLLHNKYYKKW